jgi:L-ascorbate metabolism protein UlaG (beta-lactamase superfamily)
MRRLSLIPAFAFLSFVLAVVSPVACSSVRSGGESEISQREAKIWYLGHCGYAVRTQNYLLIFDYIELEENPQARSLDAGFIDPEEIKDLKVRVFVTHSHIDHYDEVIFTWEKTVKDIEYYFGWHAKDGPHFHNLPAPRAEAHPDGIDIYTVNSHHDDVPEVAYLVKVDGLTIFHGGDYQGRMARNAPSNVPADMEYLKTKADDVDLFFIGAWTGECNIQAIEYLKPKVIFPMHYRKQESKYLEFASDLKALGISIPVICPTKRGDRYEFRNGVVQ